MDHAIPGPSASIAAVFPDQGPFTLAGEQPLDTDGTLLRGTRYDNRPLPKGAASGVVEIDIAPAGCIHSLSDLDIASHQVTVPCGLIPGASGGGLFAEVHGELLLIGVLSTVAPDLAYNGVTPLEAIHRLLDNLAGYIHTIPHHASARSTANVARS